MQAIESSPAMQQGIEHSWEQGRERRGLELEQLRVGFILS